MDLNIKGHQFHRVAAGAISNDTTVAIFNFVKGYICDGVVIFVKYDIEDVWKHSTPMTMLIVWKCVCIIHYNDVLMGKMASQITSLTIVYSTVYLSADLRKHQSSASLAFVREIHRWPVNFPHKWPVTRKMFPFDDVIMPDSCLYHISSSQNVGL